MPPLHSPGFPPSRLANLRTQGPSPTLRPPHRTHLPLWLALLLKKQRRANIVPPPWLHPASLRHILTVETKERPQEFSEPPPYLAYDKVAADGRGLAHRLGDDDEVPLSPPFLPSCTAGGGGGARDAHVVPAASALHLPYHWLEVSELLLAHAADDMAGFADPSQPSADPAASSSSGGGSSTGADAVRKLLRDVAEVRAAKLRASTGALEAGGEGARLTGVGAMELAEQRAFLAAVADGVRRIGWSGEERRRELEAAGRGRRGAGDDDDDDDDGLRGGGSLVTGESDDEEMEL